MLKSDKIVVKGKNISREFFSLIKQHKDHNFQVYINTSILEETEGSRFISIWNNICESNNRGLQNVVWWIELWLMDKLLSNASILMN